MTAGFVYVLIYRPPFRVCRIWLFVLNFVTHTVESAPPSVTLLPSSTIPWRRLLIPHHAFVVFVFVLHTLDAELTWCLGVCCHQKQKQKNRPASRQVFAQLVKQTIGFSKQPNKRHSIIHLQYSTTLHFVLTCVDKTGFITSIKHYLRWWEWSTATKKKK